MSTPETPAGEAPEPRGVEPASDAARMPTGAHSTNATEVATALSASLRAGAPAAGSTSFARPVPSGDAAAPPPPDAALPLPERSEGRAPDPAAAVPSASGLPAGKRCFDVAFALVALVAAAPFMLLIALAVKLSSRGPVFFRQVRYGRHGREFRIIKFRKMAATVTGGAGVTGRHDYRMTGFGRLLERTKLDELPQLFNVLAGEMSVVGPRPEAPRFADQFPEAFAEILSTPPGLAGPTQIRYRNESEHYPADCRDREQYYLEQILPEKIEYDLAYVRRRSWFSDAWILVQVIAVTLFGVLPLATLRKHPGMIAHLVVFPCLIAASLTLSFLLRFDFALPADAWPTYHFLLAVTIPIQTVCFLAFSAHQIVSNYFNILDLRNLLKASVVGTGLSLIASVLFQQSGLSRLILVLHVFLLTILGVFWLSFYRQFPNWWGRFRGDAARRLRITVAYMLLGTVAFLSGYGFRFGGFEHQEFRHPLWQVVLWVAAVNGATFFVLQGFHALNRVISFGHHFNILKITLTSSLLLYISAYLFDLQRNFPRSLIPIELVLKYAFVLILKYLLARWYAEGRGLRAGAALRTALLGTLAEVDAWFLRLRPDPLIEPRHLVGVILVQEFHQGMTIHSFPILGEIAQTTEICDQLSIDRVLVLARAHEPALHALGVAPELLLFDPDAPDAGARRPTGPHARPTGARNVSARV